MQETEGTAHAQGGRRPRRLPAPLACLAAAALALVPSSCKGAGNGGNGGGSIPSSYWGSWVRLDREQYLYFGDEGIYARLSLFDSWTALTGVSASSAEITASDNGIVSGSYGGTLVTMRPDAAMADWLAVASSSGTAYYRRAGARTATFTGKLKKEGTGRALVPAGGVSLVIRNVLNAQDQRIVTTSNTGSFEATGVIAGDSFTIAPAAGSAVEAAPVSVTPRQRGEDIGVIGVSGKGQDFKAEYDYSPTPVEYGMFSSKFMVAGYTFTPMGSGGAGEPFDLYYDVTIRIRNTGRSAAADFRYALTPSANLDLRADSAPLTGAVAGPLAPGEAQSLVLHLRRPSPVDPGADVAVERIGVAVTDSSNYEWQDGVELRFWRKLVYVELFRYHKGPLLGEIATPERDASGAWLSPAGDAVEWYYLPYRREGYVIGIHPASQTQGPTLYSVGFDASFLARVAEFETLAADPNESNDTAATAVTIPHGGCVKGIIGPGDADYFTTGAETAPAVDETPPAEVSNLAATAGDRSITLTWTEPPDPDYRYLEITGSPGDLWANPDKGTTSLTFSCRDHPDIANGTAYSFQARAVDYSGNKSDPVFADPNPIVPAWAKSGATRYALSGSFASKTPAPAAGRFLGPCAIALDGAGDYLVADTGNNRVQRIAPDGSWLYSWGRPDGSGGSAAGEFSEPGGVAAHGNTLYVADTFNNRIQAFDLAAPSPTPTGTWGSGGAGNGQFSGPKGLACDGTYLYASDTSNDRIQVFDAATGAYVKKWTGLSSPEGLCLGQGPNAGYLYIADYGNKRIARIATSAADGAVAQGVALDTGGHSYAIGLPSDVAADATRIYVAERYFSRLLAFDAASGAYAWHREGAAGSVGAPAEIILDGSGRLIAADACSGRDCIARYATATGAFDSSVGGTSAGGDGSFSRPCDVASSPDGGAVYVTDWAYNRIQAFSTSDPAHPFLARWGGEGGAPGSAAGQFDRPRLLAADAAGRIYVADSGNNRVQVLDGATGAPVAKWGASAPASGTATGSFDQPWDVAISKDGTIAYVADMDNKRVQKFSTSPPYSFLGSLDCALNPTYLLYPTGIAADAAPDWAGDIVVVLDRVLRFDGGGAGPLWPEIVYGNQMSGCYDVEIDRDGNIYAAIMTRDGGGSEIRKYSPAGSLIATLSKPPGGFGSLAGIGLVPLDAPSHPGRIYAADETKRTIFFYDPGP